MRNWQAALNVLWLVFGGWLTGLLWLAAARAARIVVGHRFCAASTGIAEFAVHPFGRDLVGGDRLPDCPGHGNAMWFVFIGGWLALAHLLIAVALFATILGIPFGMAHLRLAAVAIDPLDRCESRAVA